jgi:hypothetical protein
VTVAVLALFAGGVVAVATATPASAGTTVGSANRMSWTYTDSLKPLTSHKIAASDAVPLGSWHDKQNRAHTSRAYGSFDISGFSGKHVSAFNLGFTDSSWEKCERRSIEVWATAHSAKPTWAHPPKELTKLGTIGASRLCSGYFQLDVTAQAQQVLAAGGHELAVELRLSGATEHNVSLGRTIEADPGMNVYVVYNTVPEAPTQLFNGYRPCSTIETAPYLANPMPVLEAIYNDADVSDRVTAEFDIWPVDQPDQATHLQQDWISPNVEDGVTVREGTLADATTYAWHTRANDGTDQSGWSPTCYFHTDFTRPAHAPVVTSPNYPPQGGMQPGGEPIVFDLTAGGADDVVGYEYEWQQDFSVHGCDIGAQGIPSCPDVFSYKNVLRADGPGGAARIAVSPPRSSLVTFYVRSFDRAGSPSDATRYELFLASTAPSASGPDPELNVPFTLALAPRASLPSPVTEYRYSVDYGAEQKVTAAADGTAALALTFSRSGSHSVEVRSVSANGWVSSPARWAAEIADPIAAR